MSGLMLKLAPEERFYVNGTVFENGETAGGFRVSGPDVRVLRHRDALQRNEVRTPVTQVYYTIQLLITGDLNEKEVLPALEDACADLNNAFAPADPDLIPVLQEMIRRRSYFSALCYLKPIIKLESQLIGAQTPASLAA